MILLALQNKLLLSGLARFCCTIMYKDGRAGYSSLSCEPEFYVYLYLATVIRTTVNSSTYNQTISAIQHLQGKL